MLAYLPALTAAPGRMPADSKLYLYLDPRRLMGDAFHNLDPRQFGGWVPHQHISYLWPSGPWFAVFETLGVPDWVAHRLWIGTLLFTAGLGVRWLGRLLGLDPTAALVAAVVYQCSPYLLPYVSRTSVMLLPWAGLGWIIGLTMLATLRSRWRHAALAALVVFTVGAVNPTALLMVAPAPVLWLLHATTSGLITWRRATATAVRIGTMSIAVSLWWIVAVVLQSRHGADVLAYSETLESTSFASSAPEVLRGLGYWLFYVRDPVAPTTTAALDHLASGRTVAIGLLVVLIGLTGLVLICWRARRYAVWLLAAGVVLGVGIHPFADPSPLMSLLTGDGDRGLALALRSSSRAAPMSVLAVALGAGALIGSIAHRSSRRSDTAGRFVATAVRVAPAGVIVLAVAGLPSLWSGGLVDPALERDQDPPAAWVDAVTDIDSTTAGGRVLQVPGAEFGAFRWGYTVDQPLPGMSQTPLLTRDLLPLGSPAMMDLLYALDDRFQQRVLEPDSIAPVARLLGVDTVWLTLDQAFERFRTPRPDIVADWLAASVDGLGPMRPFGDQTVNAPVVAMIDEEWIRRDGPPRPLPPVGLLTVDDATPVVRATEREMVIVGDGAGLVDAAAAGLLDPGLLVHQTLVVDPAELPEMLVSAERLVVTDTDRPRARQWRSSQDTLGMTEDGSGRPAVLRHPEGDARLDYGRADRTRTVAEQRGPVTARASAYGEPFAYRPETRAVMAIDGDPTTAWRVADRADAIGEHLELEVASPIDHLVVLQPTAPPGARRIAAVEVTTGGAPPVIVELDERSLAAPGQRIDLGRLGAPVRVGLAIDATTAEPGHPDEFGSVGFALVSAGLGDTSLPATSEVVVVPTGAIHQAPSDLDVSIVLSRERVGATDRWRSDPEPTLRREIDLPRSASVGIDATVRLDPRAPEQVLASLLGVTTVADRRLVGVPEAAAWAATDGDPDTAWISPIGAPVGSRLTVDTDAGLTFVELRQPTSTWLSTITRMRASDTTGRMVEIDVAEPDLDGVSRLDLAGLGPGPVTLEVTAVDPVTTIDRRYGESVTLPVAIVELTGPGLDVAAPATTIDTGCLTDLLTIDGNGIALRITGPTPALLDGRPMTVELCHDAPVDLPAGRLLVETAPGALHGLQIDRLVIHLGEQTPVGQAGGDQAPGERAPGEPVVAPEGPSTEVLDSTPTMRTVRVGPCPNGCWFVLGEGYNPAWRASLDGSSLPPPTLVDGGSNGWWLEPADEPRLVTVDWSPQWVLTTALALTAIALLVVLTIAWADRRHEPRWNVDGPTLQTRTTAVLGPPLPRHHIAMLALAWIIAAGLAIAPMWALAPVPLAAVALVVGRVRWIGFVGLGLMVLGALTILWRVIRQRPAPDLAWVLEFADLHRPALFAVSALLATALWPDQRTAEADDTRSER